MPQKKASADASPKKESKSGIIQAVQTPLGLCALIVLVIEALLAAVSLRLTGANLTILVVGMIVALFVVVVAAAFAIMRPHGATAAAPAEVKPVSYKYDVFLSVPMAGFATEEEYAKGRAEALEVIENLRVACGFKVAFYAAQHIKTRKDFDAADLSVTDDLEAIHSSKYFVMIYPSKIVSSCIFEAGYAVALGKPSIYFVRTKNDLPFLLQQAGEALNKLVRIREVLELEEMTKLICKHKLQLFPS